MSLFSLPFFLIPLQITGSDEIHEKHKREFAEVQSNSMPQLPIIPRSNQGFIWTVQTSRNYPNQSLKTVWTLQSAGMDNLMGSVSLQWPAVPKN